MERVLKTVGKIGGIAYSTEMDQVVSEDLSLFLRTRLNVLSDH